ncbi:polyphosphate kinase [Sphingorhabdus lutea]|uniref:Polyphosphate kinase n=1 Tax=Sphingorhabdus lutea TaxID=1913578 RepID=A0A1L3JCQ4_9SPHN|nr:polyphosphate kinase [Sphingorhabdus lutea]APG62843.1 polyphosphate kinase [Sphingorhabdus lutea]
MTISLSNFEAGSPFDGNYAKSLKAVQKRLGELQSLHILHNCRTLIIVEGWDAAGKGGAIRRLTANWDPRYFEVYSIGAPTAEEKEKHFLWRFWNKLPRAKEVSVLDRSHYGRVLVERVEGFASEAEWRRGYDEINEFEAQQRDIGTNIIKIFLHVTAKTQDIVLQERLETPSKRWKVTAEDFRNRSKRTDYEAAIAEMFRLTDTRWAPWKIFDSNNQKAARIAILNYIADMMEKDMPKNFPELSPEIAELAKLTFGK